MKRIKTADAGSVAKGCHKDRGVIKLVLLI